MTKRECHKSLKAALHLCAYLLSLLNQFFNIESEFPSIVSFLELKQCNWNIICTVFVFIWQVRWPETECLFSGSAISKLAPLHTTNRKATNFSGILPRPHPVLSLYSDHTHEHHVLDFCSSTKQRATNLTPSKRRLAESPFEQEKNKQMPFLDYELARQHCKSFQTACYQEQIIDWGNTINENDRPQKSLNKISALRQSIQSVIPQNLFSVFFVICAAQAKLL